jgi:peptide/nickel transport system permease protein
MRYLLSRLLLAIPTLLVVSVIVFHLGQWSVDDPVSLRGGGVTSFQSYDPDVQARLYADQARGWADKPLFYFGLSSSAYADTMHRVFPPWRHQKMRHLAAQCGQWPLADRYERASAACIRALEQGFDSIAQRQLLNRELGTLNLADTPSEIDSSLARIRSYIAPATLPEVDSLAAARQRLFGLQAWAHPVFRWYGLDNQYHTWLMGFVGLPQAGQKMVVWDTLRYPLYTTVLVTTVAMLLALGLAVPLGIFAARWQHRPVGAWVRWAMLLLFSLPVLVIGSGLRYGFATAGHGWYVPYLGGVAATTFEPDNQGYGAWLVINHTKFILPIATIALHLLALLTLQMRTGMLGELGRSYIRTARAKGLSERAVHWRHALRNALFPIITAFAGLLPGAVGGSLVTEAIFRYHGIGEVTMTAFERQDYPVLMAVVMLVATITILSALLADWLYTRVNPKSGGW